MMERKVERHEPVMVSEILDAFQLAPGMVVVDGTLGLGGHAQKFIEKISPNGKLIGFDWDENMLALAKEPLISIGKTEVILVNKDFLEIQPVLRDLNLKAHAILLDLGLNSAQVDDPQRGFSFSKEGPLDMRMDRTRGEPAAAVLNRMTPLAIEQMLKEYGDERWAKAIANEIVKTRKQKPLRTTTDLTECVLTAIPKSAQDQRIHPATRTFQAVRIYVNRELDILEEAIRKASEELAHNGVLAVLSYHSGEDRIVKHTFRDLASHDFKELYKKPQEPSEDEARRNPRARSAKLRALQKQ